MSRQHHRASLSSLVLSLVVLAGLGPVPVGAQESWDAVYLEGAKVGQIHTYVAPVQDRGRELVRVRVDMELNFKRLNDQVTLKKREGTIETPEGSVLKLDSRTLASEQEMRTHGEVVDGKMTLTLDGAGQSQHVTIPWGPDVRGPYAAEQSLARQPIKAGESRPLKMFITDLNKICEIVLTAKGPEEVALGGGVKRSLMRVEQKTSLEGKPRPEFDMTLWIDSGGQVFKSANETLRMETYRTTREGAAQPNDILKYDQIVTSIVKVTHKLSSPETTRDVTYRVAIKGEDPALLFPTDRRQAVRPGPNQSGMILEVKTAGPNEGAPGPERPDEEFLRPNAYVTSEDPTVADLAVKAVGNAVDPWEKAKRVEDWVAQNIRNKNFATTFAPASEVARNRSGDCTEHGILTAAMCRSVGVPARVAVGLVYAAPLGGFGFHLWNEVYVNRRWVAIDAAFGQTSVDASHIKLTDSSLDGISPYESFLPVLRVVRKLTLEPLEIRGMAPRSQ